MTLPLPRTAAAAAVLALFIPLFAATALSGAPADRTAARPQPSSDPDADRIALRTLIADTFRAEGNTSKTAQAQAISERPAVQRWLDANRPALERVSRAGSGGLPEQPWGLTAVRAGRDELPTRLHLFVFDWHTSGKLVVYGLAGGVGKAYVLQDASQAALPAERVGKSTVFAVPKDAPDPLATVVVLEVDGKVDAAPVVVRPLPDGRILLHARDAVVHGRVVRYEPEPHKDTIGYWTRETDWVSWDFDVETPGTYAVEILQGCGKGNGGSTVNFVVGNQVVPATVQDTGGFQKFVARPIGTIMFPKAGQYTLDVKPVKKAGNAVMDLRSVTLTRSTGN